MEDLLRVIKHIDGVDYKIVLTIDDLDRCSYEMVSPLWCLPHFTTFVPSVSKILNGFEYNFRLNKTAKLIVTSGFRTLWVICLCNFMRVIKYFYHMIL